MIDTIIFDFFGTLVDYSHSRRVQNYSTSHSFLEANGASIAYEQYVLSWDEAFCTLENESQKTLIEFSLDDVVDRFRTEMPICQWQRNRNRNS
jgi:putative hydrolase of the HAD superfamily